MMSEILRIHGGRRLNGIVPISGMKNAALPILFACALNSETCILSNVPDVSDIRVTLRILSKMGCDVRQTARNTVEINGANFKACTSDPQLVEKIRASSYLMGVELGRTGSTCIACPGGCHFGKTRKLDYHIKCFEKMGADMECGYQYRGYAPGGLHAEKLTFDEVSVGATVNVILASVLTSGTTTIVNAAREPHIVSLCIFLNLCGARISGAGTSEIHIEGVSALHGCSYTIIPDMIEAGTYMAAVAGTGGRVTLTNVIPKHLESISNKLTEMGAVVEEGEDTITVSSDGILQGTHISTAVYPGFPTDMQPQFGALLCAAEGTSTITDKIWMDRFAYLDQLARMGASISHADGIAFFTGGQHMTGAPVTATDLRGGAALVIAGLMADGYTEVASPEIIDRGYDHFIEKLSNLGACIERRQLYGELAPVAAGHPF